MNKHAGRPAGAATVGGFRPDIEGLRAVAVLAVLLYHFGLGPFSGEFVGVDVFFVISGFVIAQSLASRETGSFRAEYSDFWERRIRRLLPALVPVVIVVYALCFALYLDTGFKDFSENLRALGLAASNWSLLGQAGYFEAPADTNPLLHTWSLSVEAQYYLLAPILAFAAARVFKAAPVVAYAGLTILSFILAVALVAGGLKDDAFFNSLARFWEIAVGAVVALSPRLQLAKPELAMAGRVIGLTLIGIAVFAFSDTTPFPGPAALLPVAGAALIVASAHSHWDPVRLLLSSPPARYIGRISYSLYLWHWPILVFVLLYFPAREPTAIAAGVALSILLAAASYHLVERPVGRLKLPQGGVFLAAGIVCVTMVGIGHVGVVLKGIPQRLPENVALALSGSKDVGGGQARCTPDNWQLLGVQESKIRVDPCLLGDGDQAPTFLLVGDSHSGALIAEFDTLARAGGRNGLAIGYPSCAPIVTLRNKSTNHPHCDWLNETIVAFLRGHPEISTVVLAARWSTYVSTSFYDEPETAKEVSFAEGVEKTLSEIAMDNREVWLLGQVPSHAAPVPESLAVDAMISRPHAQWAKLAVDHADQTEFVTQTFEGFENRGLAHFEDLAAPLCMSEHCLVDLGGRPLYSDTNHLTNFGASSLAGLLHGLL